MDPIPIRQLVRRSRMAKVHALVLFQLVIRKVNLGSSLFAVFQGISVL
jgi:hypothetical protein